MNDDIKKIIHQIREILSNLKKTDFDGNILFSNVSGFPAGCCGIATDLIGLYLFKYHELESIYVYGKGLQDKPYQTHAWLRCQNYIVDITADQFNDEGYKLASVIIEKQSNFHDNFTEYDIYSFSAENVQKPYMPKLLEKVVSELNKSKSAL